MPKTTAVIEDTQAATEILQSCLCSLIDLQLQVKQVHWNIQGEGFLSFHRQLDDIYEQVGEDADEVAERIVTLGKAADGTLKRVLQNSKLGEISATRLSVAKGLQTITDRLTKVCIQVRESIDAVEEFDKISQDVLIEIGRRLEKYRWLVESQQA